MKKLVSLCALALAFTACTESSSPETAIAPDGRDAFENVDSVSIDVETGVIELPAGTDSLVVSSLESLGGAHFFMATDDDPVDPSFDWDSPLDSGAVIKVPASENVRIVALDESYRITKIWTVKVCESSSSSSKSKDAEKSSSSSSEMSSSSSAKDSEPAEKTDDSSSSSEAEDPTEEPAEEPEESSSSSSEKLEESSSSIKEESSSSSSLMEESSSSTEVAENEQLPGSDFDSWDKSFWGSTSDAMATEGSGTYKVLVDYTVTVHSEANAVFENSKLTLTTRTVAGKAMGIDGGWKMAGGFYFAGSYSGTDAASIYIADNEDAGADNRPADFSQYMKFGRPFTLRPVSFDVTYSYAHVDNTNDTYPQSDLIYVMLVSADNKVVAAGYISDTESVEDTTKTVLLKYGDDVGLLASGYAGTAGLTLGTGEEEVASIRVMFASSALAFVADGGTSSQMKKNFRGGEGSQLILDHFKLNY